MNTEFITVYGKVILERNILHIRTMKLQFTNTVFARWAWALLPAIAIIINIFEPDPFRRFIRVLMFSIVFASNLKHLYELVLKRSFAARIPLCRIRRYEVVEDENGLEVHVKVFLASGRFRKISFRKHEAGLGAFTQLMDSVISQPQFV